MTIYAPTRAAPVPPDVGPALLPSKQRFTAELTLALIGAGALAVTYLWWQNTSTVSGLGGWLTNAGRLTGLWAGFTVVVLLALMARVPVLERDVGADRLARWHAMGGRYTVCLAVAHTVLIIWGYAVSARTNVVAETVTLELRYPDVLMATVALGLLVAVGVTSARKARRRLSYETWHFIHLYTYLAIALAFSHQFATGADFVDNRAARWLWSALYVGVGATLVWYRLLVPVRNAVQHPIRVSAIRPENDDVISVYLSGSSVSALGAQSGQFFRWRFLTRDLWWAANPYSLSAAPRPDELRITVKVAGKHSAALRELKPGTRVLAEGPYGALTAARRRKRKVLLLAGGVGITPLRALMESIPAGPGELTLLYRARSPEELILRPEIEALAQSRGFTVLYLMGRSRADSADHLSPERLRHLVPDVAQREVYLCGPEPMMQRARGSLLQTGVRRRAIHLETFAF